MGTGIKKDCQRMAVFYNRSQRHCVKKPLPKFKTLTKVGINITNYLFLYKTSYRLDTLFLKNNQINTRA